MAIVQGGFDVIFGKIKDALETYSATQIVADRFIVYPDYYRVLPSGASPANVFLYMGNIIPTEQNVEGFYQYDVSYIVDMVAQAKGALSSTAYDRASEATGIRLRTLIQQCLNALFVPGQFNFGLPAGTISKKPMPQISPLPPDSQIGERPFAGARMTLTFGLCFEPGTVEGTATDGYLITADKWSALI